MAKEDSTLDASINIDNFYSQCTNIDSIKSYVNVFSEKNKELLTNFLGSTDDVVIFQQETSPQENRCNAFYRLLGLPIVYTEGASKKLYNPGFNLNKTTDDIKREKNIAEKVLSTDLKKVFDFRSSYYKNISTLFSTPNIRSSVFALSSINKRKFSSCLEKNPTNSSNFFKITEKDQSHSVNFISLSSRLDYKEYVDADGSTTVLTAKNSDSLQIDTRYHLLRPFMPDPRISFSVLPQNNQVRVPFLSSNDSIISFSNEKNANIYAQKSIIEKVCTDRFYNTFSIQTDPYFYDIINQIKSLSTIKDKTLLNSISNQKTSEFIKYIFTSYFNVITNLLKLLKDAEDDIKNAERRYIWVPIVNQNGIDFGVTTRNIVYIDPNIKKNTSGNSISIDNDITVRYYKNLVSSYSPTLNQSPTQNNSDTNELVTITDMVANIDRSEGIKSNAEEDFNTLVKQRSDICDKANKALQVFEKITGEFSGFGLIDLLAVNLAMYLISEDDLLSLLDDNSLDRFLDYLLTKQVPSADKDSIFSKISAKKGNQDPIKALVSLEGKVLEIFNIIDQIYESVSAHR